MLKLDQLRAHLTASIPEIREDQSRLQVFLDRGTIRATGVPAAGGVTAFEYAYDATLIFLDFAGHPDAVMVALTAWISTNQPELHQNFDRNRQGVRFEADILSAGKIDLQIVVPLTERVGATPRPGGVDIVHFPEPAQAGKDGWPDGPAEPPPIVSIWADGELIAELPGG